MGRHDVENINGKLARDIVYLAVHDHLEYPIGSFYQFGMFKFFGGHKCKAQFLGFIEVSSADVASPGDFIAIFPGEEMKSCLSVFFIKS